MNQGILGSSSLCSQVPALPGGSRVELQPLLLAPGGSEVDSIAPLPLARGERLLALNPAAAARGEASPALVATRWLAARGRLCRATASAGALALPDFQAKLLDPI